MISFKGARFPKDVILFAVFFYVRYTVSYRDLEEIMAERGVTVDHAIGRGCRLVLTRLPLRRRSGTRFHRATSDEE